MSNETRDLLATMGEVLDGIDVAMCIFDDKDRSMVWNRTFLKLFPEHEGQVHEGEPYRENLRRFYGTRLSADELPDIDRFIEAGIARHRTQSRPFVFEHTGMHIQVASLSLGRLGRIRTWRADTLQLRQDDVIPLNISSAPGEPPTTSARLLDRVPDGLMICGQDGWTEWVNEPFIMMYGLRNRTVALGVGFDVIYRSAWAGHLKGESHAFEAGLATLEENLRFSGAPFELPLPADRFVRVIARPTGDGTTFYAHVDISELKRQQRLLAQAERAARHAANHDGLTGLMGRRMFMECLAAEVSTARRTGVGCAILYLDLDGFKPINDQHGHAIGDKALVWVAQCIRRIARDSDFVARLGGDEFAVLQRNVRDHAQAPALANRLAAALGEKFSIESLKLQIGASIGITFCPEDADDPEVLLRQADKAMYAAKENGGRGVSIFQAQPDNR